ncbi:S8 family serine peptidase [Actinophytocola sediminis]
MRHRLAAVGAALVLGAVPAPVPAGAQPVGQCTPPANTAIDQESWAQQRIAADRVWRLTTGDGIVGVVDTGVSAEAPLLAGAVLPGTDLADGRGDGDCYGRGTFIAGLIAARQGDSPLTGMAPGARVFPVRVTDDPTKIIDHAAFARDIASGIRAAVDAGAGVVAVGLVATLGVPELTSAVAYAADRDVLVVASAWVSKNGQLAFPARLPGVLAVAPVGQDGPVRDPVYGAAPALAAPAQDLVSIAPRGTGQRTGSGGELAVAYVAGAAALVRAYHPGLSARQVAGRLLATADQPGGPLPNKLVGYGVVDPLAAVTTVLNTDPPTAAEVEHLVVPVPEVPDEAPANRALWFAGGVAAVALLVAGPVLAGASGRRRRDG